MLPKFVNINRQNTIVNTHFYKVIIHQPSQPASRQIYWSVLVAIVLASVWYVCEATQMFFYLNFLTLNSHQWCWSNAIRPLRHFKLVNNFFCTFVLIVFFYNKKFNTRCIRDTAWCKCWWKINLFVSHLCVGKILMVVLVARLLQSEHGIEIERNKHKINKKFRAQQIQKNLDRQ